MSHLLQLLPLIGVIIASAKLAGAASNRFGQAALAEIGALRSREGTGPGGSSRRPSPARRRKRRRRLQNRIRTSWPSFT